MRRTLMIGLAAIALTLGGCEATLQAVGAAPQVAQTIHLDTGKALTLAYDALDGAALYAEQRVKSGELHGAAAGRVAQDLRKAQALLDTAWNAYHAGIRSDPAAAIAETAALIKEVKALAAGGAP